MEVGSTEFALAAQVRILARRVQAIELKGKDTEQDFVGFKGKGKSNGRGIGLDDETLASSIVTGSARAHDALARILGEVTHSLAAATRRALGQGLLEPRLAR